MRQRQGIGREVAKMAMIQFPGGQAFFDNLQRPGTTSSEGFPPGSSGPWHMSKRRMAAGGAFRGSTFPHCSLLSVDDLSSTDSTGLSGGWLVFLHDPLLKSRGRRLSQSRRPLVQFTIANKSWTYIYRAPFLLGIANAFQSRRRIFL